MDTLAVFGVKSRGAPRRRSLQMSIRCRCAVTGNHRAVEAWTPWRPSTFRVEVRPAALPSQMFIHCGCTMGVLCALPCPLPVLTGRQGR